MNTLLAIVLILLVNRVLAIVFYIIIDSKGTIFKSFEKLSRRRKFLALHFWFIYLVKYFFVKEKIFVK